MIWGLYNYNTSKRSPLQRKSKENPFSHSAVIEIIETLESGIIFSDSDQNYLVHYSSAGKLIKISQTVPGRILLHFSPLTRPHRTSIAIIFTSALPAVRRWLSNGPTIAQHYKKRPSQPLPSSAIPLGNNFCSEIKSQEMDGLSDF